MIIIIWLIPLPNTYSNSLPTTTSPIETQPSVVLQPVEVLTPGYPLDEEYYYDPAYFYDPYWGWGGWYGGGSYGNNYRQWHHRRHRSGDVVHGRIRPGARIGGGRARIGGGRARR